MEPDALALEYKRQYGSARRNIDITNVTDHPLLKGECRVFGPGFSEKISNLPGVKLGTLLKNVPNALLVSEEPV
jgi:hypothetical protein